MLLILIKYFPIFHSILKRNIPNFEGKNFMLLRQTKHIEYAQGNVLAVYEKRSYEDGSESCT